jgi:hypothetical protein
MISDLESIQQPVCLAEDINLKQSVLNCRNELIDIILWTLNRNTLSVSQIKTQFHMGNRADDVMDKLFNMGLVSEKFSNQPRTVLPKVFEDVPTEVIKFLTTNGINEDEIKEAIQRSEDS